MTIKRYTILALFVIITTGLFSQTLIEEVRIGLKPEDLNYRQSSFNKDSDTINQYIVFGEYYDNDWIRLTQNDSLIFSGTMTTPENGLALTKKFLLRNQGDIVLEVNDSPKIRLPICTDKNYIFIDFNQLYGILYIYYSKYMKYLS
ncbi:MAG: hypothetical protein JEZ03_18505 [Bacteroidales bacterium]|nr:hypothetical protein [Bacteroidales bacterium]